MEGSVATPNNPRLQQNVERQAVHGRSIERPGGGQETLSGARVAAAASGPVHNIAQCSTLPRGLHIAARRSERPARGDNPLSRRVLLEESPFVDPRGRQRRIPAATSNVTVGAVTARKHTRRAPACDRSERPCAKWGRGSRSRKPATSTRAHMRRPRDAMGMWSRTRRPSNNLFGAKIS